MAKCAETWLSTLFYRGSYADSKKGKKIGGSALHHACSLESGHQGRFSLPHLCMCGHEHTAEGSNHRLQETVSA
jgi:hypothetical protein